ncbi:MAG: hypothetical protein OEY23_11265 [Acidimicrobiia bacterium]|nr:hypothetical protein [Acidimicrobiia bacterium]
MTLREIAEDPARRAALVRSAVVELEAELDERSGVTAMAMRAGYKTLRKLRPNLVEQNLDRLVPQFAGALDPHVEAGRRAGDVEAYLLGNADPIAEDLLAITDARAAEADNRLAVKTYEKLRPRAKSNVVDGMGRLARLVTTHAPD